MSHIYDAIVIGTGQAGPPLARRLAAAGDRVAIVERGAFGGTCVNTGCIPTKAMVASAHAAHIARRAAEFGVVIDGDIRIDMKRVIERKREISTASRTGLEQSLDDLENCTVYRGVARFTAPHELSVGDDRLTAPRIFINVGGRAIVPQVPGIETVRYLTNSSILELETLPSHLVIVGGSYIGLEFGQMFRRFGSRVTIVEKGARLVGREDEDVSENIREILEREGIEIRLDASCIGTSARGEEIIVGVDCDSGDREIAGSHLLLAVGRRPNTDDLGLEAAGIDHDERGFIEVDDQLRTSVPGIWALGDCNGRGAFTHTSYNDFEIVAENILDGGSRSVSDRIQAYALYIDPPLARAGITEREARESGRRILVGQRPMTRVGRAVEKGETEGFMKILVDAESERIIGASILGTGGDEVIHCILDMMYADVPYTVLQRAMHIHPTVAELVPTMLGELHPA